MMLSRLALANGAALRTVLQSARPCVVMSPKALIHTDQAHRMPVKLPEGSGKVKFGFVPEEWFTMMYNKTGVTGPYMFGAGLVLYMLNKELYILGPETIHAVVALSLIIGGIKKFGPSLTEWADKQTEEQLENAYKHKDEALTGYANGIKEEKLEQWRLDGRHYLFDAKKENVQLQIETEYRERQIQVTDAVKSRMDYHIAVDDMIRRKEQEHMVNWIVQNVIKNITPQQEKDILTKSISKLKTLASTA